MTKYKHVETDGTVTLRTARELMDLSRAYFQQQGAKGGAKAASNMTAEQRKERALKGVAARQAKRKAQ